MARQTVVYVEVPDPDEPSETIQETWALLTHSAGDEWWSEILDGHRHPQVVHDEHGYDTVRKYFGETVEESVQAALVILEKIVKEKRGKVLEVGAPGEG